MRNLVIIEVNENLLIKFSIKKAWPGKTEMSYLTFTVCWNTFRAFGTSNADLFDIKRHNTVTFQRIRQSARNQI